VPTQVTVQGDTRLKATLAAASASLAHMDAATGTTAQLVRGRAVGAAPKRTGRLAGSLSATSTGDTARVSSGQVYAGVIHYGWAARGIRAHPFLVPVAEQTQPVWIRSYQAQLKAIVGRVRGA
jgi:phage gpG-like protein